MVNKMAMLAEPRRKTKYSVDPRGTSWSNDDSKFGQKLMEKMGWSKGKGLGAKEDGNKDHVSVYHKTDKKGIGCAKAGYTDDWIAHQDDFSALLNSLNEDHGTGGTSTPGEGSNDGDTTPRVISLEQTSKSSKGRVHYQKFTKGKDLSLKSENDLDCVFGKRRSRPATDTPQSQSEASSDASDADDNGGLKTVTSTDSVQDYFARKMAERKKKLEAGNTMMESAQVVSVSEAAELWEEQTNGTDDTSDSSADRKKKQKKSKKAKKRKVDEEHLDGSGEEMVNDAEGDLNAKKKRKVEDTVESSVRPKKRVSFMVGEADVEEDIVTNSNDVLSVQDRKKLKKDKRKKKSEGGDSNIVENGNDKVHEEPQCMEEGEQPVETSSKKRKKRKSKGKGKNGESSQIESSVMGKAAGNVKDMDKKLQNKSNKSEANVDRNNKDNVKVSNDESNSKKSSKKRKRKKKKVAVSVTDIDPFRGANMGEIKGYEGFKVSPSGKKRK